MSEKKFETDVDLHLIIKEFEKMKKQAQKDYNEEYSSEEPNEHYLFKDLWLDWSEEIVEGNVLKVSGGMKTQDDKELGYISLEVPLDFDKLIDVFQSYIKKLQKVKTVMEATKEE